MATETHQQHKRDPQSSVAPELPGGRAENPDPRATHCPCCLSLCPHKLCPLGLRPCVGGITHHNTQANIANPGAHLPITRTMLPQTCGQVPGKRVFISRREGRRGAGNGDKGSGEQPLNRHLLRPYYVPALRGRPMPPGFAAVTASKRQSCGHVGALDVADVAPKR